MRPRPIATEWEVVPGRPPTPAATCRRWRARCRRMVTKRALFAAGVAVVPIPGIDWLTDLGVLVRCCRRSTPSSASRPEQIERLAPDRRIVVYKAISAGGGLLVGACRDARTGAAPLRLVGVRLTAQQAAKYVPLAGQAVSAALTFTALKFVCEQHIQQCLAVARATAAPARPQAADDEAPPLQCTVFGV